MRGVIAAIAALIAFDASALELEVRNSIWQSGRPTRDWIVVYIRVDNSNGPTYQLVQVRCEALDKAGKPIADGAHNFYPLRAGQIADAKVDIVYATGAASSSCLISDIIE